jgi:hypothetical protein
MQFLYEPLYLKDGSTRPFRFFSRLDDEEFVLLKNGDWKRTDLLELARFGHNDVATVAVNQEQARALIEQYWGLEVAEKVFA